MSKTDTTTRLRHAGGNWIIGTVDGLEVQAKAFHAPSQYGMLEDRRISKLWVKIPNGAVVYNYDRGGPDVASLPAKHLDAVISSIVGMVK